MAGYKIVESLGVGGYGAVYKVEGQDGQLQALKLLKEEKRGDAEGRKRFSQEADILSRLSHESIVKVYAKGLDDAPPWYTMEFLAGPSLDRVMKEEKWPLYRKVEVLQQIASAVGELHGKSYIHRDIKPQNIKFRASNCARAVLFDLGLVHDSRQNLTMKYQTLGTPSYMSPEQQNGDTRHQELDIWAIGMVMYEWLTGVHPFMPKGTTDEQTLMRSIETVEVIPPQKLQEEVDAYLSEVCCKALAKDWRERYHHGKELENALINWPEANRQECLAKAEEMLQQSRVEEAIAFLEEAHLWDAKTDEATEKLAEVWAKKLGWETARLYLEVKFEEAKERTRDKLEEIEVAARRTLANPQIRPESRTYFICRKKVVNPYGLPPKLWENCRFIYQGQAMLDMSTDYWCHLSVADQQQYAGWYQKGYAQASGWDVKKVIKVKATEFAMVLIPPGLFWMGSPESEKGRDDDETLHRVVVSKSFWIGKYPVTQGVWQSVMGKNPAYFWEDGSRAPVERVSWDDCQNFCQQVGMRLPEEAEWEYACRSGVTRAYCFGDDEGLLGEYAWYAANAGGRTQSVGQKRANAFGLHDMYGNVWEWCQDWYGTYSADEVVGYTWAFRGSDRILRGGSWNSYELWYLRSASRSRDVASYCDDYTGVRLVVSEAR